jgi:ppGpp synthetase/RelA/SpoT-type nucleotidyltranferase
MSEQYEKLRTELLTPLAKKIGLHIQETLIKVRRIDRVTSRAKSTDRFIAKAEKITNGIFKYKDPLSQIQDQIGARIVVFYLADVERVSAEIEKYFRPIEAQMIVPDSDAEFGYFGKHYILFIPSDVYGSDIPLNRGPRFFELQIKTLFQHAWSEAEHDLGYKPSAVLSSGQRRHIAFSAAQAWGADMIFDQLHRDVDRAASTDPSDSPFA